MNPIQTRTIGGNTIEVYHDEYPINPRENDNLGTMYYQHRNYILGDKPMIEGYTDISNPSSVVLPLYLYDHSGITMSTSPFSCPWDSGQVGYICATAEDIRKNFGVKRITKKLRERVEEILKAEVEEFDRYIRGESYLYLIKDEDGEVVESCSGFDSVEYCMEEGSKIITDLNDYLDILKKVG